MAADIDSATAGLLSRLTEVFSEILRPQSEHQRERRRIVGLCLPFLILLLFSGIIPLLEMFRISFSEARLVTEGFTFQYYEQLIVDPYYRTIAINTLWFALATTVVSIAIAVPVVHALEKYDLPFESVILTILSFPNSLPGIVAAFMIIVWFSQTGILTNFFSWLTGATPVTIALTGQPSGTLLAIAGLFLGYLYSMIPRATFLLRGSYAEVNTAAEEAARSLGATPLETFRYVTLPQVRPGIVGALILTFRTALAIFGTVLVLKALSVITFRFDQEIQVGFNLANASALATVFFVFTLLFTFLGLRFTSAEVTG